MRSAYWSSLEGDVERTLQSIKKGIALLDERQAEIAAEGDGDGASTDERWEEVATEPSTSPR